MNQQSIKKKAHSQTLNKLIGKFEGEFDIEAEGETPTKQMDDLIEQLHEMINGEFAIETIEAFVRKTVVAWYKIGANRGMREILKTLNAIDTESLDELPEKIEWKSKLGYFTFEGDKVEMPKKKYSIKLVE